MMQERYCIFKAVPMNRYITKWKRTSVDFFPSFLFSPLSLFFFFFWLLYILLIKLYISFPKKSQA